jgi:hypothetical protein
MILIHRSSLYIVLAPIFAVGLTALLLLLAGATGYWMGKAAAPPQAVCTPTQADIPTQPPQPRYEPPSEPPDRALGLDKPPRRK